MDPFADNYDEKAKQDDLSCSYTGNVVFWTTALNSDALETAGHVMLRFELEGEIVDSIATASFGSSAGSCNTSGTKTISRQFSGNFERTYKYRVKGLNFTTLYEGFVTIPAGDCIDVKLGS